MSTFRTTARRFLATALAATIATAGLTVAATPATAADPAPLTPGPEGLIKEWSGGRHAPLPPQFAGTRFTDIAYGFDAASALTASGEVIVWGWNGILRPVPTEVAAASIVDIEQSHSTTVALSASGEVFAWGPSNSNGEHNVPAGVRFVDIDAGFANVIGVDDTGHVHVWGQRAYGEDDVPAELADKTVVQAEIAAGSGAALTDDGTLYTWGDHTAAPTFVAAPTGKFTSISMGEVHGAAQRLDGTLALWGIDYYRGTFNTPPALSGKQIKQYAVGGYTTAVLTEEDEVFYWGISGQQTPAALSGETVRSVRPGNYGMAVIYAADRFTETSLTGDHPNSPSAPVWGEELTASGTATPAADTVTYTWFAAGAPVGTGPTYTPTADQARTTITVTAALKRAGYRTEVQTYSFGSLSPRSFGDVGLTITGTNKVGDTLTAAASSTPTADSISYVWYADGVSVGTGETLEITESLVGKSVRAQAFLRSTPYFTAAATAEAGISAPATLTDPALTVTGTPTFGSTLTATATTTPTADTVTYSWYADGNPASTGPTFTPDLAHIDTTLELRVTATKAGYSPSSSSQILGVVKAAEFTSPTVSIAGTAKVGQTLTASSTATPAPEGVTYTWFADGNKISEGDTVVLPASAEDARITVRATVSRPGYTAATVTSAPTAQVVTAKAPTITLRASTDRLRLGKKLTLDWVVTRSTTLRGSWSGTVTPTGSVTLEPARTGTHVYRLTASNENGTTTAQVAVRVTLPATKLRVTAPTRILVATSTMPVRVRGLAPRERFTVRVAGTKRYVGHANRRGVAVARVVVPRVRTTRLVRIRVIGSVDDRVGTRRVMVAPRTIGIRVRSTSVRASDPQRVTVIRLAPRERVVLAYQGRRMRTGHANALGVFTATFDPGLNWGTFRVTATATQTRRTASATFSVTERCPGPAVRCA